MTDPAIFREYDIRGTYGRNLFDDDAYAIGRAVAQALQERGGRRIAVGRDGRLSAPALEAALVDGLRDGGLDAVRIGVGPTPMLYYAEASMQEVDGGIHVTGSHNPRDDNGFKIVFFGGALFGAEIQRIGLLAADVAAAKRSGVAGELGAGEGVASEGIGGDLAARWKGRIFCPPMSRGWSMVCCRGFGTRRATFASAGTPETAPPAPPSRP